MTNIETCYPISWLKIGNTQSALALPFLREKSQPIAGKELPTKPHKSGPSKKEKMTAKIPKGNKMARNKSGRCP
jgi:hypothetical protein